MSDRSISPTALTNTLATAVTPDTKGVKDPLENDVLCGRGGSINSHPGNEKFRLLVEKRKRVYLTARFKREKRLIANSIVQEIQKSNGRFLSRDPKTGLWMDIGDEKARDKTSQALRENAPSIRAEIETEINEQRAEMVREDEESEPQEATSYPQPYSSGWGYFYGYQPPPPPPPVSHPAMMPPASYPHPHYAGSYYHGYGTQPDPYLHPTQNSSQKSVLDQTAEFVSAGTESLKNWTKQTLAIPAGDSSATTDSKPISYKHERKMVKFREGDLRRKKRPCYSPVQANDSAADSMGSIMDHDHDLEPQNINDTNSSLMAQVANHILGSIGSWDAMSTVCGNDSTLDRVPFPQSSEPTGSYQQEDMTVEWEGQEVQLVDEKKDEERMPPPPPPSYRDQTTSSIAFSSLGSCHSWIPEQVGAAASFFSGRDEMSMDMEHSTNGNFSVGESIGGGSLARVFEHEVLADDECPMSPHISNRVLNQMPSWERNLRSRSPLSVGSHDDDDISLISRTSSKLSDGPISPMAPSSNNANKAWRPE